MSSPGVIRCHDVSARFFVPANVIICPDARGEQPAPIVPQHLKGGKLYIGGHSTDSLSDGPYNACHMGSVTVYIHGVRISLRTLSGGAEIITTGTGPIIPHIGCKVRIRIIDPTVEHSHHGCACPCGVDRASRIFIPYIGHVRAAGSLVPALQMPLPAKVNAPGFIDGHSRLYAVRPDHIVRLRIFHPGLFLQRLYQFLCGHAV